MTQYHPPFRPTARTVFSGGGGPACTAQVSRVAPDRQTAAVVNARGVIVERARRCAAERGRLPNVVAVDFYGIGDVFEAVDELNGLGG